MGRTEWNRLTKKGKEKRRENIVELTNKLTNIEDNFEKIFDLEEAIEDNLKDLFECDSDCSTCSLEDLKLCHQHFRKANLFWIGRFRYYDEVLFESIKYLVEFIQNMHRALEDIEDEEEFKKKDESDESKSLYA